MSKKYSFEFKKKCIEMYYKGSYPETPEGLCKKTFHREIRCWVMSYEIHGDEAFLYGSSRREWTAEDKLELVKLALTGEPYRVIARNAGIHHSTLSEWVQRYKMKGYQGLMSKREKRLTEDALMKKEVTSEPIKETEREELIRLRAEVKELKLEIEIIKKFNALMEREEAAAIKARKQHL